MTKEITKAIILQEIQDKFKLREFAPSQFLFDETVVPVYEIGSHLRKWGSKRFVIPISSATGHHVHTIPATEKWTLRAYTVVFFSGAYTIAGMYIVRNKGEATTFSYLDLTAAQSVSYLHTMEQPVVLEPLDKIYINADDYTSTGNVYLYLDYMTEEVR